MNKEYCVFVFRCRMCGCEYSHDTASEYDAMFAHKEILVHGKTLNRQTFIISMYGSHYHKNDGSFGVADYVGIRKEKAE